MCELLHTSREVFSWLSRKCLVRRSGIAAEFVRLNVDVIVTGSTAVPSTKQATSVIPIVFVLALDPVGGGLVASLARPGGNVTGLSIQAADLAGKRLEILREVVPGLRRLAIMGNVGFAEAVLEMGEVQAAARTLGLEVAPLEIRRAEDIAPPSRRSRPQRTHFMSRKMLSLPPTALASLRWRSARGCRRSSVLATLSKPGLSCPTDQTSRTSSGARRR
jgi:ABC transporter substrate binding protein